MRFILLVSLAVVGTVVLFVRTAPARALRAREADYPSPIAPFDLVFQDLDCGPRCALIRRMTGSSYVHVGIVLDEDGERVVWEAFGPVGPTPLDEWVERGVAGRIAVYRPKASLGVHGDRLAAAVRLYRDRPYDGDFQWDDERIYCSELIAKAYRVAAGRDVFPPHVVDLGTESARIAAMTHGRLLPTTRVVSPADLARSGAFTRVVDELEAPIDASVAARR